MIKKFISLLLFPFLFWACSKKNDSVNGPIPDNNLLPNSSFEFDGNPSLSSWIYSDTFSIKLSNDVPVSGGNWSVSIDAVWGPPSWISSKITTTPGTHIYKFSFWAKAIRIGGTGYLELQRADSTITLKSVKIKDSVWYPYTLIDTVNLINGDSIIVNLTGGFSHKISGKTYYDLCRLEKN